MLPVRNSLAVLAVTSAAVLGCNRTPDDLRQWRPSDHKHQVETNTDNGQQGPQVTGSAQPPMPGLDEVTIATWRRACTTCHGELGRGDGPQGPMVHARDLSDSAWQAATSDAQIAETITKGRGRMPAFSLPASTVDGLVHLVRLFDRERLARAAASARAARAAPAASASAHGAAPASSGAPRSGGSPSGQSAKEPSQVRTASGK